MYPYWRRIKTIQIYANLEGFARKIVKVVHCLGWCHIMIPLNFADPCLRHREGSQGISWFCKIFGCCPMMLFRCGLVIGNPHKKNVFPKANSSSDDLWKQWLPSIWWPLLGQDSHFEEYFANGWFNRRQMTRMYLGFFLTWFLLLTNHLPGQIISRPHTGPDFPQMVVNCKGNPRLFQGNLGWWHIITGWWFQRFFYFHPYLGKIPILTNIFQVGGNPELFQGNLGWWNLIPSGKLT